MTPTFLSRLSQDSFEALKVQLELFLRRAPGAAAYSVARSRQYADLRMRSPAEMKEAANCGGRSQGASIHRIENAIIQDAD